MKPNKDLQSIRIAYIGGGSRGWAWQLMRDLAIEKEIAGQVALYDIDFEEAKHNETIGNNLKEREDVVGKWDYKAYETIGEALTGADFVVISIMPGTFDEMASDVHLPEEYGIYQSVGDTAGPGGIVRALRTIPMMFDIAEAIKKYAPDAWVINYTNPMSLCVKALYTKFPEIKAFGCCHEVFGTASFLCEVLKDMEGIEGVKRQDLTYNVIGINHFTFFDKASYNGTDLFPIYDKFIDKYYDTGFYDETSKTNWMNNTFSCAHRVKFDLFKRYGNIAAAGDRHLAEFCYGKEYLKDPETVKSWKFGLTTVDWRKKDLKERLEKSRKYLSGKEQIDIKPSGEEGVLQMKALLGLGNFVTNVNIINRGQVPQLPLGSIVETNAYFSADEVRPVLCSDISSDLLALFSRHIYNHETIMKSALTGDLSYAFRAFLNDPLVTLDAKTAKEMFDRMIDNTKKYLTMYQIG